MKRLLSFGLVLVLSLGLLSFGVLAQESDSNSGNYENPGNISASAGTTVSWEIEGCSVALQVHDSIDEAFDFGNDWTPGNSAENSDEDVYTESNCPGYELQVEATDWNPSDDSVNDTLGNFEFWVNDASTDSDATVDVSIDSEGTVFDSEDSAKTLGNVDGVDMASGGGFDDNDYSTTWEMSYKYTLSTNDAPGDYSIDLSYTVTAE